MINNDTCSFSQSPLIWILKLFLLLMLIILFYLSFYYYYKSLKSIKHNELEGR